MTRYCLIIIILSASCSAVAERPPYSPCDRGKTYAWSPSVPLPEFSRFSSRSPRAVSTLQTAGLLPHEGLRDQSLWAKRDFGVMRDAALYGIARHDPAAVTFAERYLVAWHATYQPTFRPIDETSFDALIDTYNLVKKQLPVAERNAMKAWLLMWGEGYVVRIDQAMRAGHHKPTETNNWQSHRVKLVTKLAVATDNSALFNRARQLFRQQVMNNIHPDGEVLDYRQRKALHYVVYDLQPLVEAALAAGHSGENWYNWQAPDGASLSRGVTWLEPWLEGRPHQEFVDSQVKFDRARAKAGVKGFSGLFDPHKAAELIWLASPFDPSLLPLAERLEPSPSAYIRLCVNPNSPA